MRCALLALAIVSSGCFCPPDYRINIGRTAVDKADGAQIGTIVTVALVDGVWVYQVRGESGVVNSPVQNVQVVDSTP